MKHIAFSLPTGIGAKIGGYAGDIGHIVREYSKYFKVIVNPNAVNGGILSAVNQNMLYVEGYAFDEFICGNIALDESKMPDKIGVLFDCAIPKDILNVHINTLNALKLVMGFDILDPCYTKMPVGVEFSIKNAISSGAISNPTTLLEGAKELINKGAQAIAAVCYFGEDADDENYSNGTGIDPIGGVEAVISHLITKELKIPCAHSPAFYDIDISRRIENPKVASECVSSTYLPCIIQGLARSPKISKDKGILNKDIKCLVVPDGALGSKAVLGALENNIKVCAVKNPSKLNIGCDKLKSSDILSFDTYQSCLEHLKEG